MHTEQIAEPILKRPRVKWIIELETVYSAEMERERVLSEQRAIAPKVYEHQDRRRKGNRPHLKLPSVRSLIRQRFPIGEVFTVHDAEKSLSVSYEQARNAISTLRKEGKIESVGHRGSIRNYRFIA